MSKASLSQEQLEFVSKVAAEAGAKAGLEAYEQARQKEIKALPVRLFRNTKELLKQYRNFKAFVKRAVYETKIEVDISEVLADLMMPGRNAEARVKSIMESRARTATMVKHMEVAVDLYKTYCFRYGTKEDIRRWRVIDGLYISDDRLTVSELAEIERVVERTIYKDVDIACDCLSGLVFGVDGVKWS